MWYKVLYAYIRQTVKDLPMFNKVIGVLYMYISEQHTNTVKNTMGFFSSCVILQSFVMHIE